MFGNESFDYNLNKYEILKLKIVIVSNLLVF